MSGIFPLGCSDLRSDDGITREPFEAFPWFSHVFVPSLFFLMTTSTPRRVQFTLTVEQRRAHAVHLPRRVSPSAFNTDVSFCTEPIQGPSILRKTQTGQWNNYRCLRFAGKKNQTSKVEVTRKLIETETCLRFGRILTVVALQSPFCGVLISSL